MAIALLLATNRHVLRGHNDVLTGEVFSGGTIPYQRFRAWQLSGRTAGLVGLGAVGRALRWRLQGLGMEVLSFDPYAADATHKDLESLLAASDVVSMHAAVTPETLGMIGAEQFAQMRDGAIFLNTARAALHDTDALVDALRSGKLAGAGLDHFEGEMLPAGHPLLELPTAVLTPHIGGATYDTEANHTTIIANDLERLLNGGRPNHCANKEVLA
jgi:D-3-phosphoglycerate dehydrogenase